MKKKLICLIICLGLVIGLGLSAAAAGIGYVTDAAGILSAEEVYELNAQAQEVSEYYGCGVYIVVVDNYKNYVHGSIQDFSETVYNQYALGLGEERNGIVLSLSMADRDYDLCAYGDFAHYAFTDYGKEVLSEKFLDDFRYDDWMQGFNDYISFSIELLELAKTGNPLDEMIYEEQKGIDAFELVMMLVFSCGIAGMVCLKFKRQMKTAVLKTDAFDYVPSGGMNLRINQDRFLHRTVTRTRIKKDDEGERLGDGGRPRGTTINSGGFSHKSGKF